MPNVTEALFQCNNNTWISKKYGFKPRLKIHLKTHRSLQVSQKSANLVYCLVSRYSFEIEEFIIFETLKLKYSC